VCVSRGSDARDIPKGGRVEAIPINSELTTHLKKAIAASPSELVFPDERGQMLPKYTAMEEVLRRAMRRAGIVTGYVHKCRRKGCGHHEPAPDANPRRCPVCKFKLCPVGQVRKLRFHHLRHTTASLLLMQGADLAAVQRIMRHQDPRITTEVYGHLAPGYLKKEIDRLRFEPAAPTDLGATVIPISAAVTGSDPSGSDQPVHLSAGGALEPPLPAADLHAVAAPFSTRFLPKPPIAHAPSTRRRAIRKHRRGVTESGREDLNLRPFGPETGPGPSQGGPTDAKPAQFLQTEGGDESSHSQGLRGFPQNFSTRFLPNSSATAGHRGAEAGGAGEEGQCATQRPPARGTAATLADLKVLWGGRDQLLRVGEVAEHLAVGAWRIYQLCEDGDLPHVRINNSIRVRPRDLEEFVAARLTIAETRRRTGEKSRSRSAAFSPAFACEDGASDL
jgi:excisionase family DNA binding protein